MSRPASAALDLTKAVQSSDYVVVCAKLGDVLKVIDVVGKDMITQNSVWRPLSVEGKCDLRNNKSGPFFVEKKIAERPMILNDTKYVIWIVQGSFFGSKEIFYSFTAFKQ